MDSLQITYQRPSALNDNCYNAKVHSAKQLAKLERSIGQFGFIAPVLVDEDNTILAGHARVQAARTLKLGQIPTISVRHLSAAQRRAYMIADNKIAELADYDEEKLAIEFEFLIGNAEEVEITDTGFEIAEVDFLIGQRHKPDGKSDEEERFEPSRVDEVCRPGDLWLMGEHRVFCGDALDPTSYRILLGNERADMIFCDPPYNLKIPGVASGLGKAKHQDFAMASGEMSREEFRAFLQTAMARMIEASRDGSLHYLCMDWRQIELLLCTGRAKYSELKAICVWNKGSGGMGSLYRGAHEFIAVFKAGTAPHTNNIQLGAHGRNRTNVWSYPGLSSFGRGRNEKLAWHPTVKNLAMVADAILDCTNPGQVVLDPFAGSGTTALAAQRCGRRAALVELDPKYCDRTLRRFCDATGIEPVNAWTGERVRRKRKQGEEQS